jgi:flagellar motor switch protein FliN/FliY
MKTTLSMPALTLRTQIAGYAGEALRGALNSLTGTMFEVGILENTELEKAEEPLIWQQPFSLANGACFWLVAGKDLCEAVSRMIAGGVGEESVADGDCRKRWSEIAGQTMSGLARAISGDPGRPIFVHGGEPQTDEPDAQMQDATLEVRNSIQIWQVRIAWNRAFADACPALSPQMPWNGSSRSETPPSKTLELLMDVALPVSVSFGKASLQIREVLKLNTGSVVELNRLVSEPVEVIVNNCVIARGEVVVVDGNYGVRVIHLASRADRLRSGMSEASSRLGW